MTNKSTEPGSNNNNSNNNNNNNDNDSLSERSKLVSGEQASGTASAGVNTITSVASLDRNGIKQEVADIGGCGDEPLIQGACGGANIDKEHVVAHHHHHHHHHQQQQQHLIGDTDDQLIVEREEESEVASLGVRVQVASETSTSELDAHINSGSIEETSGQQQQLEEISVHVKQELNELDDCEKQQLVNSEQSSEFIGEEGEHPVQQLHGHDSNSLMGHPQASGVPEYTLLTPVTPIRVNQMSTTDHQASIAHTPTAILTDLDAASAHEHQLHQQQQQHDKQQAQHHLISTPANTTDSTNQDGSQQQQQQSHYAITLGDTSLTQSSLSSGIKIEPNSQPGSNSAHEPLTELTPAAIGTTLSELATAPSTHSQDHNNHHTLVGAHHNVQQLNQGEAQQQQLSINDNHQQLIGPSDHHQQQQQHSDLLSSGHQQLQQIPTLEQQQLIAGGRQQTGDIIAPTSGLNIISASNASTSSACSSTSNTGASSTGGGGTGGSTNMGSTSGAGGGGKRRTWNQVNRNLNKTEIPKVYSPYGFRCYLETPISTCRRKEEDRITYINKGEFYGLSLEYIPDPQKPLRSAIVKTVVMLVFREEKPPEEDLKSWQFWHSRQHSAKQRILDADNKNHVNVINQIEEVSLNAIAFYWNPIETRNCKLNVAVQCLSTDFSNQKGVKGLPLNLQVDIYDLFTETSTPVFRGYATLLSYCDKGAQRRSRDEERRALKRKLADASSVASIAGGAAKRFEDLYHKPCDRSEFYAMADLIKPPTLYTPSEESLLDGPKQPMSQSSGVSITPISATTPIPSMESMQYNPQAAASQQQLVPLPQQSQHPQTGSVSATVINTPQSSRPVPQSSYNIVPSSDYLQHPPQSLANTTGIGGPAQAVIGGSQQQPSPLGTMVSMGGSAQQQQSQQQHLVQQQINQQQHQVMSQQHQHHYHAVGNTLQPSYGIMQTDHHQPQQYAILQAPPSLPMVQSHHHHQQTMPQQQLVATSTTSQQHPSSMDSRGQQHQQPVMMSQAALMQQTSQQQQQQQQQQQMQQMHQYQQPIVGITTASIPISQAPFAKRAKLYPDERVLIYAKQADEKDFYPLHLSPPSLTGLVYAIEQKYKIDSAKVANIYKKSKKGIRVQMDDEMIRLYCNEDMVQLEVIQTSDSRLEITLVEL